jgi:tight adherence protein B
LKLPFAKPKGRPKVQPARQRWSSSAEGTIYTEYHLSATEYALCFAVGGMACFSIGYLFYHSFVIGLLLAFGAWGIPGQYRRMRIQKQMNELRLQFKQGLHALVTSLTAGRSIENAFAAAAADLGFLYNHPQTFIVVEFHRIRRRIANGEPIERALEDFCRRSGLEELTQFLDVFVTAKRTGGNMADVMRRTSQMIGDKMEIQQDIAVQLAQRRFESRILGAAPLGVIGLLYWSSPDYMEPLYGNAAGAAIMTAGLAIMLLCWWLTGKLMEMKL